MTPQRASNFTINRPNLMTYLSIRFSPDLCAWRHDVVTPGWRSDSTKRRLESFYPTFMAGIGPPLPRLIFVDSCSLPDPPIAHVLEKQPRTMLGNISQKSTELLFQWNKTKQTKILRIFEGIRYAYSNAYGCSVAGDMSTCYGCGFGFGHEVFMNCAIRCTKALCC